VTSVDEYVDLMNNLKLPNPKMMDVAVPANMKVGLVQEEIARRGCALSAAEALAPSASARPWRCRRRRTRASRTAYPFRSILRLLANNLFCTATCELFPPRWNRQLGAV